jgi:hypothetical protein
MKYIKEFIKHKESKGEKAIYRVNDTRGYTYYSDDYVKWLEQQLTSISRELRIHDVIKSVCDCSSETFAHYCKGGDKCGYCGGKAES